MYRMGHVGTALLAYAPVGYVLLADNQPVLAVAALVGVLLVEPLPDNDMWIPGLAHRGTSHSLLCALLVGGALGTFGWFVGDPPAGFFALADSLAANAGPFGAVFAFVGDLLGTLDERALATFGFAVGTFGILTHLLADVITVSGIRPLLPLSSWRLSLSRIRADDPFANTSLFVVGTIAVVVVALATAPAALALPADLSPVVCPLQTQPSNGPPSDACVPDLDLSPVGTAAGQSTNATNATVAFANQTTNGSNVTIESAMLPEGGFIALHSSGYTTGGASAQSSVITTSGYLESGEHTNVTIEVANAPPGNYPGLNRSQLNESAPLTAIVYKDTNGNGRMDYVSSLGQNDTAYSSNAGSAVADMAGITVPTEPRQQASVTLTNQTTSGEAVTIESARLPDGGHIVIHNASYRSAGPLDSAVGITSYLEPGNYSNVQAPLINGSVTTSQQLVAVPYRDTNDNQRYDYVASGGFRDVAYENRTGNQSIIVNDSARAVVSNPQSESESTAEGTTSPTDTSTPFRVTNLSVSNRTARVDDEIIITAHIENPTNSRLEDDLALATAGEVASTQDVALFPQESRAVTFEHSYDSAGEYVIKVGDRTKHIRIVGEGEPLTTTTPNASNGSVRADSGGAMGLTSLPVLVAIALLVVGIGWMLKRRRDRHDF